MRVQHVCVCVGGLCHICRGGASVGRSGISVGGGTSVGGWNIGRRGILVVGGGCLLSLLGSFLETGWHLLGVTEQSLPRLNHGLLQNHLHHLYRLPMNVPVNVVKGTFFEWLKLILI